MEDFERSPDDFIFSTFDNFKTFHCNLKYAKYDSEGQLKGLYPYAPAWLGNPDRREYKDGMVFDPSGSHKATQKNLWSGLAIKANAAVEPILWLQHLFHNVCSGNDELFDYILNYYAHAVQKPWELPKVALVFRGNKGVGKGTEILPLKHIFGDHFFQTQNLDKVLGIFNSQTQNKLIIFLNETVWGGYKKLESSLKGIITEPAKDIERKGVDGYQVCNFNRVIIDSNETWAVPTSTDERRYCFINIADHENKQDTAYFRAIDDQMNNGGYAGLLHILATRNIEGFHPINLPKDNRRNGIDMATKSLTSIQHFLMNRLADQFVMHKQYTVLRTEFYNEYVTYCNQQKMTPESNVEFYRLVRESFADPDVTDEAGRDPEYLKESCCHEVKTTGLMKFVFRDLEKMRQFFTRNVLLLESFDWDAEVTL